MSSQLKPWERARMGGVGVGGGGGSNSIGTAVASTTVMHPPSSSQTQAQTQNSSYSSSSSSQQPSSLPSSSFGYNRYGLAGTSSSYGSYGSYGNYGGYGSSSSGYGLGYGGFSSYASSPYSSSFGYGASSLMSPGMGVGGIDFQGGLIGNGLVLMNQIMEGFSRFSYLFGATFEAFRNAVMSLLGMYKGLSPILGFAKSFTIFK